MNGRTGGWGVPGWAGVGARLQAAEAVLPLQR